MKRVSSVISSILLTILVIAVITVAVPNVVGIKIYTVLSGSMEPELKVGDLIYVVPTEPEKIKEKDIISFVVDEKLTVVTHQVVGVDREKEHFTTKGTANNTSDAKSVIYGNVIGVVKFSLPLVGYLFSFFLTTQGRIIGITIAVSLVLITLLLGSEKGKPLDKTNSIEKDKDSELDKDSID